MRDFETLKVWEKGHQLTLAIYRATKKFPKEELFGLTRQMRGASASIPTYVAEGCGVTGKAQLGRFLQISMGSASELEYQLIPAHDLGLLTDPDYRLSGRST